MKNQNNILVSIVIFFLPISGAFANTICPFTVQDGSGQTLTGYTVTGCDSLTLAGSGSTTVEDFKIWIKSGDFIGTLELIEIEIFSFMIHVCTIWFAVHLGFLLTKPREIGKDEK